MAEEWREYTCKNCAKKDSVSRKPGHLAERNRCIWAVQEHFGYLPFVSSRHFAAPITNGEKNKRKMA